MLSATSRALRSKVAESLNADFTPSGAQQRALRKLKESGALLAYHGLGSGKTSLSIAGSLNDPTDVVVPASLRENYRKEVGKFVRAPSTNRHIRSYEDFATNGPTEGARTLVIDEAHRLGNPDSSRTRAFLHSADQYQKRILLTGTPIRNAPHELGPLIKVLNPDSDVPTDPDAFDARYITPGQKPGFWSKLFGRTTSTEPAPKNLGEIAEAVRGRVDYQPSITEGFPTRRDVTEHIEMSPEQADIYRDVTEKANPQIAAKVRDDEPLLPSEERNLNAFMSAARQISNSGKGFGGTEDSPKLQRIADEIERSPKSYTYSGYLGGGVDLLAEILKRRGVQTGTFSGKLSDVERKQMIDDYNSGKLRHLLGGPSSAEGLDLKGTRDVFLMDPHWNEQRLDQVIGRAIRHGSHAGLPADQRSVTVHHLLSTLPKPGWIRRLLGAKQDVSADQYLTDMAARKQREIEPFLDVLRREGSAG